MKKILFLFLLVLMLSSCSSGSKTVMLVSESGMEIYTRGKHTSSMVVLDAETVQGLCAASDRSPLQIASQIAPDAEVYYAGATVYGERQELYSTLLGVTASASIPDVWKDHEKELKDSLLLSSLSAGTNGFDSVLADLIHESKNRFDVYHAEDVLEENCDYASAIVFLKRWIKAIIS